MALVGRPELLVLDEPTAGMDPAAKATVRALIGDLRAAGRTILLTTHELADVERLADRVVVIDRGRLLAAGTPAELVAGSAPGCVSASRPRTGALPSPRPTSRSSARLLGGARSWRTAPPAATASRAPEPDPPRVAVLAAWCSGRGLLLAELRTTGGTLEERFLELIAGRRRRDERRTGERGRGCRPVSAAGSPRLGEPRVNAGRRDVLRPGDRAPFVRARRVAAMLEMELRLTARAPENLFVTLVLRPSSSSSSAGPRPPDAATARPGAPPVDGVLPAILAPRSSRRPREPRHLDRLRALLRRAQAPRRLAADARPAAGREGRHHPRGRGRPGGPARRPRRRSSSAGPRRPAGTRLSPSSRPSCSGRPPSARSASSSPAPCAPRRRWP